MTSDETLDMTNRLIGILLLGLLLALPVYGGPANPLQSWNDGPARDQIMDFVARFRATADQADTPDA